MINVGACILSDTERSTKVSNKIVIHNISVDAFEQKGQADENAEE